MKLLHMIRFALSLAILASFVFPLLSGGALAQTNGWEFLAPGIDYQWFRLSDPNNVFVSRMDRSNPNVTLEGMLANSYLYNGGRRYGICSAITMARWLLGQAVGTRMDAVVGINGSSRSRISDPTLRSGQVQSGGISIDSMSAIPPRVCLEPSRSILPAGLHHRPFRKQNVLFLITRWYPRTKYFRRERAREMKMMMGYCPLHHPLCASTRTVDGGIRNRDRGGAPGGFLANGGGDHPPGTRACREFTDPVRPGGDFRVRRRSRRNFRC